MEYVEFVSTFSKYRGEVQANIADWNVPSDN